MQGLSLDEVAEQLDIGFLLERESLAFREGRGVSGPQLNIKCCPFCGDSRWRTYFGLETGQGNCFVCSRGFTTVSISRAILGDPEWSAYLKLMVGILREQGWRPKRVASAAVDHGEVALPTAEPLPLPDGSNLVYLEQRGFHADICRYFGLRWCQFGWWKYRDADGIMQTQNFSDRVIIPVFDLDGTLKTFQGRDLTGTSTMKYLFPKELPGTGRYLLNGHNVIATDHVVMCEGAFDVAAVKLALDEDVSLRHVVPVGSFGKHLSYGNAEGDDQLGRFNQLRKRGLKIVTIMWDGEPAALLAALDAAKLLAGINLVARIAMLPYGKDPNEVTPDVVRAAYYSATVWSPTVGIKLRLRNPYTEAARHAS